MALLFSTLYLFGLVLGAILIASVHRMGNGNRNNHNGDGNHNHNNGDTRP